jgi:hypothetical protein
MPQVDVIAMMLLVVGALNWGLERSHALAPIARCLSLFQHPAIRA